MPLRMAALLIAGLLALPFAGLVLFVAIRLRRAQRHRHRWQEVAEHHRLHYVPKRVWGKLGGRAVEMAYDDRLGQRRTVVWSEIAPPLDLGLQVQARQREEADDDARGQSPRSGIEDFDQWFSVSGDSPHRVRALMTPLICQRMVEVMKGGNRVYLGDGEARIEADGQGLTAQWHEAALQRVVDLAEQVQRASQDVPMEASLMGYRAAWEELAGATERKLISTPLAIKSGQSGTSIYARRLGEGRYGIEVCIAFPRNLGIGLWVAPWDRQPAWECASGQVEMATGDDEFDRIFRTRACRKREVAKLLDDQVRRRLQWLYARHGRVWLRDGGLIVGRDELPTGPGESAVLEKEASAVMERIFDNARKRTAKHLGAYGS